MRLTQLKINNFGIYNGSHSFDFPYSDEKKVSLIIGKNGSGKTTFLNSLKICLFGSMILRSKTITPSYEQFIINKLNKKALQESDSNHFVEAIFISHIHNYDGEFKIRRSWNFDDKLNEKVTMYRNNIEIESNEINSFFNALYHAFPLDLFELYYLDGEKIDSLSVLNTGIIDLIESSINIDLFKTLKSDLINYASKKVNSTDIDALTENKEAIQSELVNNNLLISQYIGEREQIANDIEINKTSLSEYKNTLLINVPKNLSNKKEHLTEKIFKLKKEIEIDLTKFLPYSTLTKQLDILQKSISEELDLSQNQTITSLLNSKDLRKHLNNNFNGTEVNTIIKSICDYYSTDKKDLLHNISHDDIISLRKKIESLQKFSKTSLKSNMIKLNELENELKDISSNIEKIHTAKISGELDNISEIQNTIINLSNRDEILIKSIEEISLNIDSLEKEIKSIENELWRQLKKDNITNVLSKIDTVLGQYIDRIKESKIRSIEIHAQDMFQRLIRKNGFIKKFQVQSNNILLLDHEDNKLNHSNLSAGEKHLFVLSLLYAIIKTSERNVPLVFDTLLGRLDEEHRDNVFKEFIKDCPDQVIILATDSELANIDKELMNSLVNKTIAIDLSKKENQMFEVGETYEN